MSDEHRKQWLESTYALAKAHPKSPAVPLFRGHKVQADLFTIPEFATFKSAVQDKAQTIAQDLKVDLNRMDLTLDHAWANINGKGDFNEYHSHPNCDFSGVYYLKSMPSLGSIRFRDPREPVALRTLLLKERNLFTQDVAFPPVQGMMYIFPAWLMHQVDPNPVDFDRISLSFNISFKIKQELQGTIQKDF
ncbi:MAG: hypothetical protein CMH56_10070 [Myxococcales bacterium]|nr:hypothetical protein [Myxococcales bacterium]|tara:strand:+ start:977 stop:1549 length:573 start_codon:yes stop_codon:yes gene_type:complete